MTQGKEVGYGVPASGSIRAGQVPNRLLSRLRRLCFCGVSAHPREEDEFAFDAKAPAQAQITLSPRKSDYGGMPGGALAVGELVESHVDLDSSIMVTMPPAASAQGATLETWGMDGQPADSSIAKGDGLFSTLTFNLLPGDIAFRHAKTTNLEVDATGCVADGVLSGFRQPLQAVIREGPLAHHARTSRSLSQQQTPLTPLMELRDVSYSQDRPERGSPMRPSYGGPLPQDGSAIGGGNGRAAGEELQPPWPGAAPTHVPNRSVSFFLPRERSLQSGFSPRTSGGIPVAYPTAEMASQGLQHDLHAVQTPSRDARTAGQGDLPRRLLVAQSFTHSPRLSGRTPRSFNSNSFFSPPPQSSSYQQHIQDVQELQESYLHYLHSLHECQQQLQQMQQAQPWMAVNSAGQYQPNAQLPTASQHQHLGVSAATAAVSAASGYAIGPALATVAQGTPMSNVSPFMASCSSAGPSGRLPELGPGAAAGPSQNHALSGLPASGYVSVNGSGYGLLDPVDEVPDGGGRAMRLLAHASSCQLSPPPAVRFQSGAAGSVAGGAPLSYGAQPPLSPPRSSVGLMAMRVSVSGAASVLSMPVETGSVCDFTTPDTGLVAEQTALEMGALAPMLDLWVAGANVSPLHRISEGAHGVVYRGSWHGCTCALKVMLAASAENLSAQLTELFLCRALSCHPNIVQTFDCSVWRVTSDTLFAIHRLCDGGIGVGDGGGFGSSLGGGAGFGATYASVYAGTVGGAMHGLSMPAGGGSMAPASATGAAMTAAAAAVATAGLPDAPASLRHVASCEWPGAGGEVYDMGPHAAMPGATAAPQRWQRSSFDLPAGPRSGGPSDLDAGALAWTVGPENRAAGMQPLAMALSSDSVAAAPPSTAVPLPSGPPQFTAQPSAPFSSPARPAPGQLPSQRHRTWRDAPMHSKAAPTAAAPVASGAAAPGPSGWTARVPPPLLPWLRELGPVSEERLSFNGPASGAPSPAPPPSLLDSSPVFDNGAMGVASAPPAPLLFGQGQGLQPQRPTDQQLPASGDAQQHAGPEQMREQQMQQQQGHGKQQGQHQQHEDTNLHEPYRGPNAGNPALSNGNNSGLSVWFRSSRDTRNSNGSGSCAPTLATATATVTDLPSDALVTAGRASQLDVLRSSISNTRLSSATERSAPLPRPIFGSGGSDCSPASDSNSRFPPSTAAPSISAFPSAIASTPCRRPRTANAFLPDHRRWPSPDPSSRFAPQQAASSSYNPAHSLNQSQDNQRTPPHHHMQDPMSGMGRGGLTRCPLSAANLSTTASLAGGGGFGAGGGGGLTAGSSPANSGLLLKYPNSVSASGGSRLLYDRTATMSMTAGQGLGVGVGRLVAPAVRSSAVSTGDEGDAVAAEAGARNLAQVLRQMSVREGQLAVILVMEECDRGSLQALLNRTAEAAAAVAGASAAAAATGGVAPGAAYGSRPLPLYTPFAGGGRYSPLAALRAAVQTAKEVALGMAFLHVNNIIHGDLKPGNVLLKGSRQDQRGFVVKISDFGLSRVLHTPAAAATPPLYIAEPMADSGGSEREQQDEEALYGRSGGGVGCSGSGGASGMQCGGGLGTVQYMAPELINDGQRSKASDVWAYGVILWQLVTGLLPYEGLRDAQIMFAVSAGEQLLSWPAGAHPALVQVGHACLSYGARDRPTFAQIVRKLQQLESELSARQA